MSVFPRRSLRFRSYFSLISPTVSDVSFGNTYLPSRALSSKYEAAGNLGRRVPRILEGVSRKNVLEETKVQEYLKHIASTSQDVTLADIERHRPSTHARPGSSKYEEQYNVLVEALVRSFSSQQLRKFLALYHLSAPHKRTKWELASLIVEHRWKWPSLETIKKKKRDWSEVVQESFPLDARQSFLILGKDGAHLLGLSSEFNAHISFSVNPLCLRVEGLRGSIDKFRQHIQDFKAAIQEELFQLPPGGAVKLGSLQHVSRFTGVFLEDMGQGLIRVSYGDGDSSAVHFAKRLMLQETFQTSKKMATLVHSTQIGRTIAVQSSTAPQSTYAPYPFFPLHSEPRIFNMSNLSRIRRSRDWLSLHLINGLEHTGGIAERNSLVNLDGASVDLRAHLVDQIAALQVGEGSEACVTASFGHLVIGGSDVMSSLKGTMRLHRVSDWLQSRQDDVIFIPSLPPPLINNTNHTLAQQHLIHRLVYNSLTLDQAQLPQVLKFELVHGLHAPAPNTLDYKEKLYLDGHSEVHHSVNEIPALESKCWIESTRQFNVMMPDRPIDVQLSVSTSRVLPQGQWPETISIYSDELRFLFVCTHLLRQGTQSSISLTGSTSSKSSSLTAPLMITHGGVAYRLESSSTVHQISGHGNVSPPQTVIESAFEQESGHRSKTCKIACTDIQSDHSWDSFMKLCDTLTLSPYSQVAEGGKHPFT